jgi:hypothetical protein
MAHPVAITWAVVIAVAVIRSPAAAQDAATAVEQLTIGLHSGDVVFITDAAQRVTKGRFAELSPTSLRLLIDGRPRDFALGEISQIDRRSSDSLLNGLLLGAAFGGALFLKYYSENALCQAGCQFGSGALGLIAIGAGIGAGIDAMVTTRTTVFKRASSTPGVAIRLRF